MLTHAPAVVVEDCGADLDVGDGAADFTRCHLAIGLEGIRWLG